MAATTKLAFQPWARANFQGTTLTDTLARVNFERGHFRDINESALQEEIAQEGAIDLSDSEDGNDDDEEQDDHEIANEKPQSREDLYKARFEMLGYVHAAEQDVLLALDFISMLQSREPGSRSVNTISRDLKNAVPVGSLGTDIWQRMPMDKAREAQDEMLATNIRMEGLQKSADSLLNSAKQLKDTVRKETLYWDQILSISDKGWNVCRVPQQKHKLAVTFGFSESAPEFSRRGIASLNTDLDGSILLDRGIGRKSKVLRVTMKESGRIIGMSRVPPAAEDGETILETRIRRARDSLFDEELYHEMIRESRSMASIGVSVTPNGIKYRQPATPDSSALEFSIQLVGSDDVVPEEPHLDDTWAEAAVIASRLLLSEAHRSRLIKRRQIPPPLSDRKDDRALLPLLRPLISLMLHRSMLVQVTSYIERLASTLSSAKVIVNTKMPHFSIPEILHLSGTSSLAKILLNAWVSDAQLKVDNQDGSSFAVGFKITTTLGDWSGSIIELDMPNARVVRFQHLADAETAGDSYVASGLSKALSDSLPGRWRCDRREALISKIEDDEDDEKTSLWVKVDSKGQLLSLNSTEHRIVWTAGDESGTNRSFWEAGQEVMQ
ncbi:Hypothetical protein R9X50_00259100 [Acrodontium crateriforme]|uniref:Mediator of RNA polymerase II transcription subunit 17 n=1 Tax=Acrodontium crateriforme TaxID=150365 RepID=A0AAQ3RB43_9PEZI|nr:Hypothetical protein R9X50_00259100 [Acrodontium crateriforme]